MAKMVIFNEADPGISVILEEVLPGSAVGRAQGWHGTCTQCGKTTHRWHLDKAVTSAQSHVDSHEPILTGGDTDALIR